MPSAGIRGEPLRTREAVACDTPAVGATSAKSTRHGSSPFRRASGLTAALWTASGKALRNALDRALARVVFVRALTRRAHTKHDPETGDLLHMTAPHRTPRRRRLRIAMNGVTGRMGYRQHLVRSILPIRDQGGVAWRTAPGSQVEPILVGRNAAKSPSSPSGTGSTHWTHRPGRGARRRHGRHLLRRPGDLAPRVGAEDGDRRRASTSTPRSPPPRPWTRPSSWPGSPATPGSSRRRAGQALPAGPAQAASAWSTRASSAGSCRCAASSATGSSRATGSRPSARPGTTARRTAAA